MRERIVVIGGNAAGMTAASRAKRLEPDLRVLILEASQHISYSICGVPFHVTGQVREAEGLIAFDPERLAQERGIEARTEKRVEEILPGRRLIKGRCLCCQEPFQEPYDRLVISTGYRPRLPDISGTQLDNVFTVSRLEDSVRIREAVRDSGSRRAVVVGGGYIGLMMAEALRECGLEVAMLEKRPHVFSQLDDDLSEVVEDELRSQGVELHLRTNVRRLAGQGTLEAVEAGGERWPADLALIDVGIEPNTDLASRAGIPLGMSGAIEVDPRGQTALNGIFAAGNCAETRDLVSGRPIFSALGTTAAKQGRVVGDNLAGRRAEFPGSLETSAERVFSLAVARTGLTLRQAYEAGFEADAVTIHAPDRAPYFEGSATMHVRLVFERPAGRLLGGQIVGAHDTAKRIDVLVTALTAEMRIADLACLDLAYAPPFATLWDPVQIAANQALKKLA